MPSKTSSNQPAAPPPGIGMPKTPFRVGVVFPQSEIGTDAVAIRDFAQAVEAMGFSHLLAGDHVVGANPASLPGRDLPVTRNDAYFETLMLFSNLAAVTHKLCFTTGVIILPQRQTTLFAQQASSLDIFCQGRLQLGIGTGWNELEYETLGVDFATRGKRFDDQIHFLRRLWTEPLLTYESPFNRITDACLNPLPLQRPIPIWLGGESQVAINRAAQLADGWLPLLPVAKAEEMAEKFRDAVRKAGRDPENVGFEPYVGTHLSDPFRAPENAVTTALAWKQAGAAGVALYTQRQGLKTSTEHLSFLREVADLLEL